MEIIIKNTTSSHIRLRVTGVLIKANDISQLDPSERSILENDEDLKSYIQSGAIVVNDGSRDLSISEALDYIKSRQDLTDYYKKTEVNTFLSNKANVSHTHDSLYYKKNEVDDKISAVETFGIKGGVDTFSDLPTGIEGDIYIVRQDDGTNSEGFYQFDGVNWAWLSHNTGTTSHNELNNLNTGDYYHLTQTQFNQLTTGIETSIHIHDDRYYTETEVDNKLANKSDVTHTHSNYYTKSQVDNLINSIDYNKVSHNDPNTNVTGNELETLTNGSNADGLHTHSNIGGEGSGGLDEAYDDHSQWSQGSGREIDVDFGPVSLNASNGFAPLRLAEINYVPNQWLSTGQMCVYDGELFLYDATRSCWASVSGYNIGAGANQNNIKTTYLKGYNGTNFTDDVGWVAPWDGVITSMAGSSGENTDQCIEVRKNGNSTAAKIWYSGEKKAWANWIDVKFSEGDVLNFYVTEHTNGLDRPIVWAIIKRRIS